MAPRLRRLLEELLNLGDTSRTTDQDNFGNGLLDVGVLKNLFDGFRSLPEKVHVKFFELGTSKCLGEVVAIFEALDFNAGALLARKGPFGFFNLTLEFTESSKVLRNVGSSFLLVLLDKVLHDPMWKSSPSRWVSPVVAKTSKTPSSMERRETSKVPPPRSYHDLRFFALLVETVGNSGSGRFVNDT